MKGRDYKPGKDKETRVTSATGGQKGQKSARFGGGDALAYMELARVYGMGESKYDRYNYLKGYPWSLSIDALFRHLLAFLNGEDRDECTVHSGDHEYDPETCDGSGLLHTAHVAWHALTLTAFVMRSLGTDDRFKPTAAWEAIVKAAIASNGTIAEKMKMVGYSDAEIEAYSPSEPAKRKTSMLGELCLPHTSCLPAQPELCICHTPGIPVGDAHVAAVAPRSPYDRCVNCGARYRVKDLGGLPHRCDTLAP